MALERFGPFVLLDRIGAGGMGEAWLARPIRVAGAGDLCVVKRLLATRKLSAAEEREAEQRFRDESRVSLLLDHPCVCRTIDAGRVGTASYLAFDLVEGIDLRELARRSHDAAQPLDESLALHVACCLLEALAYAHGAEHPLTGKPLGVVHRDVSPSNVMCGADGGVRLIDFGLALSSMKEARTEKDIVLGKISYMAPEQARGEAVGPASDVFAAGVVLYELLVDDRYWGDMRNDEIFLAIAQGTHVPRRIQLLKSDVRAFVLTLLKSDPAQRATAREAFEKCAALLEARGGATAGRLGRLVAKLGAAELERVRHARGVAARTSPPVEIDPATQSFATAELKAIEALAERRANVRLVTSGEVRRATALQPPTLTGAPELLTETGEHAAQTETSFPGARLLSATAQLAAPEPTERVPRGPRAPHTKPSRAPLAIGAGVVVALAVVVAVGLTATPTPAPPTATAAPASPAPAPTTATTAATAEVAVPAAAPEPTLVELAAQLSGCRGLKARMLHDGVTQAKVEKMGAVKQAAVRHDLEQAVRECHR